MGLFGPDKMCALCGGKVGFLGGHDLANGLYICDDCTDRCTPGAKNFFDGMSPEDVKNNMALAAGNIKKGEELFTRTNMNASGGLFLRSSIPAIRTFPEFPGESGFPISCFHCGL